MHLNNGKFYFGANNLINNTSRGVFGGGAGLLFKNSKDNNYLYENHFTIIFDGSTFISNHEVEYASNRKFRNGNGGAIQIGWTEETSNVDVEILNSNFSNNYSDRQGGAVNLQIIGYILINNCTFDENIAGQKTTDPIRILGGAIYIVCDFIWGDGHYPSSNGGKWRYSDSIKIIGSKFNKNLAFDGLSIFIESSEYTSYFVTDCHFIDNHNHEYTNYSIIYQTKEFIFENSTIEFTDITKSSSAIEIIRPTKIIGSHFIKNCVQNGNIAEALLIETEANEIEISNSTFEDCGKGGDIYTSVKINTAIANIYNNTFNFTTNKQENSCQPISVLVYCNLIFSGNRISNSYCNGGLQYKPASIGDVSKENLLIEKCTFENCQGTNTRALNIKLFTTRLIFSNNTFQDCSVTGITTSGGYLLGLDLSSTTITEFVMDKIIFRNLTTDSDFTGGIGCLITLNKEYKLVFRECFFDDNYAHYSKNTNGCNNGKGGAFQYGWSSAISTINLLIENCIFDENKADQEGGALCLMIQGNIEINNCEFVDNKAGLTQNGEYFGGAISITSNYGYHQSKVTDTISIDNCSFIGNVGHEADSIYVNKSPETDLIITNNCHFMGNSTEPNSHFTIVSDSRKFEIDDCSFEYTSISILSGETTSTHTYLFTNCIFRKSDSNGAIQHLQTLGIINLFSISDCIFEDCLGLNSSCLLFAFISDPEFKFKNNIICYTNRIICDRYLYSFYFKNKESFIIENVSYINVASKNLYGGGAGAWITGINKIIIEKCIFSNNTAMQTKKGEIRPNQNDKTAPYYNGDGGGFQYGYSEMMYNIELEVRNCTFKNNKAARHGGGIALQTTKTVIVINCLFEENVANDHQSEIESQLLFENYFDLKTEGRGGAIYINPTFNHSQKHDESFMTKIEILNSIFKSNSAFDGCAIYIEGDDAGTEFIIQDNTFIDNHYNNENPKSVRKGIITSEISNLFDGKIKTLNAFAYTDPIINEVLYVDHYGNIPTDQFTQSEKFPSNGFTETQKFSKSDDFTQSNNFIPTQIFSKSDEFSKSIQFTKTHYFTKSDDFTKTNQFTITHHFSYSSDFTQSNHFISTNYFSKSDDFTKSKQFSKTYHFSKSCDFTKSKQFTITHHFSYSNDFTQSNHFISTNYFSKSDDFTKSKQFSKTHHFSKSDEFSKSKQFTKTYHFLVSDDFTQSNKFIQTHYFSESSIFAWSNKFTKTHSFSKSEDFLNSNKIKQINCFSSNDNLSLESEFSQINYFTSSYVFTSSKTFTPSNRFTMSSIFSLSLIFSPSFLPFPTTIQLKSFEKLTYQNSVIITYSLIKTVSYSISYFGSVSYFLSFNQIEAAYGFVLSQTNYYSYFPYIIYSITPLYVQTYVPIIIKKQKITKEMLIGICCGTASVFFLILGIIILAIKKKNRKLIKLKELEEYSFSSDSAFIKKRDENKINKNENEQFDQNEYESESDLLFWL